MVTIFRKHEVRRHVAGVRTTLGDARLTDVIRRAAEQIPGDGDAAAKVAGQLPAVDEAPASSGTQGAESPYFSRSPLVSLVQSEVAEAGGRPARKPGVWGWIAGHLEKLFHLQPGTFQSDDPEWYLGIARAVLERIALGNHAFNPVPAVHEIAPDSRLVVVGDWGTGLPRARDVAGLMHEEIADGLTAGRQVHVIHLGDIYYSGLESEDRKNFLDVWPVTREQSDAGVTSWCLNGNHDMYGGGYGYFRTVLADPRFVQQRSPDGKPTSFFRLQSKDWEFLGLDTSWDPDVVSKGEVGVLEDPQSEFVTEVADASTAKLVLFSHHQLVSVYDEADVGPALRTKLAGVLDADRVTAWWWGHEHRAITYTAAGGVHYPRCLGNGGVPVLLDPPPPAAGRDRIEWRSTRSIESEGGHWTRFGFAVIDLDGASLTVRYRDDDGATPHTETVG